MNKAIYGILALLLIGIPIASAVCMQDPTIIKENAYLSEALKSRTTTATKTTMNGIVPASCTRVLDIQAMNQKGFNSIDHNYFNGLWVQVVEINRYHDSLVAIDGKLIHGKLTVISGCKETKGDDFNGFEIAVVDGKPSLDYFIRG